MYNKALLTFIAVAQSGSFTKASERLFMSPTAVMKNINTFEDHLNIKLFYRSTNGISLTEAGKQIYKDANYLINYSNEAINKAKNIVQSERKTVKIGTSIQNPAKIFMDLWYQMDEQFPDYDLEIVPFDDDHNNILSVIEQIGDKFDFLIGVCDSKLWLSKCAMLTLGSYKKVVSVSKKHPLAKKQSLEISDLYNYTLMMVKKGDSNSNDIIREELNAKHPQIIIEDTSHFYDMDVFNSCATSNKILLNLDAWKDIHPGIISIPVNWNYKINYGIVYSKKADKNIKDIINKIKAN